MSEWWPEARRNVLERTPTGGNYHTDVPWRVVLHTTEAYTFVPQRDDYYDHRRRLGTPAPPHFTFAISDGAARAWQHYPIGVAARALRNERGGVQTNRWRALQVELAWRAADVRRLPDSMYDLTVRWVKWLRTRVPLLPYAPPRWAGSYAHANAPGFRMGAGTWRDFSGICGHQHVPEQTHWDPGLIDIGRIIGGAWDMAAYSFDALRALGPDDDPTALVTDPGDAIRALDDQGSFSGSAVASTHPDLLMGLGKWATVLMHHDLRLKGSGGADPALRTDVEALRKTLNAHRHELVGRTGGLL